MTNTHTDAATFWADRMAIVTDTWRDEIRRIQVKAEARRKLARFNTGSISQTAALALRAITAWVQPATVIEVGTFIGMSTMALKCAVPRLYTCDASNGCVPSAPGLSTFQYQTSTQMFRRLREDGITADLFFFDGKLSPADDVPLILELSKPDTVYVVDDYYLGPQIGHKKPSRKGVTNVEMLGPYLPSHVLVPAAGPTKDDTTLAALVPESRL